MSPEGDSKVRPRPSLEVAVVVYRPALDELRASLQALGQSLRSMGSSAIVRLWHCDEGPAATMGLPELLAQLQRNGLDLRVGGGAGNLGFGRAVNALLRDVASSHLLLLNQDAVPEPGALARLWEFASTDAPRVAAWELRQIPYEHPKDYDPVSGETGWVSGAAVLLRTQALRAVGGFEPRFFMYCEDVDLSWRLRCAGWRLRYVPQFAVVHRTYAHAGQVKPLAALQGFYANLCLRARFAGPPEIKEGLRKLGRELCGPQPFPGRRRGIITALLKFGRNGLYFRRTHCAAPGFAPCFNGWDYEQRREGAFHPFVARAERCISLPPVSVIVRAGANADALADFVACLARQTVLPAELIVVDAPARPNPVGGPTRHRAPDRTMPPTASAGWTPPFPIHPLPASGASLAAMAAVHASADWWLFFEGAAVLPYADHLEVLLQAALDQNAKAVTALTWLIQADPSQREAAHRLHAPRTTLAGDPATRPARLVHRSLADAEMPYAELAKTTTVCYVGEPRSP